MLVKRVGGAEKKSWWRHQMETFSAILALCAGNSPATGEFPSQRPVTRGFDVFFDLRLIKRLNKQLRCRWFKTPSCSLWRHSNDEQKSYLQDDPVSRQNTIKQKGSYCDYIFATREVVVGITLNVANDDKFQCIDFLQTRDIRLINIFIAVSMKTKQKALCLYWLVLQTYKLLIFRSRLI